MSQHKKRPTYRAMECSLTVGFHAETEAALREWADYEGVSISSLVRRAVIFALRDRKKRFAQEDLLDRNPVHEGSQVEIMGADSTIRRGEQI